MEHIVNNDIYDTPYVLPLNKKIELLSNNSFGVSSVTSPNKKMEDVDVDNNRYDIPYTASPNKKIEIVSNK